jgi:hypothetical protein
MVGLFVFGGLDSAKCWVYDGAAFQKAILQVRAAGQ